MKGGWSLFSRDVDKYPLWAWIVGGMTAPLAYLAGRDSWLVVLAVGAACCALCRLVLWTADRQSIHARWYCVVQVIWLAVISQEITGWTAQCWPTGNGFPLVPLTLLVLATFAAWDGAERASRTGSVLFWFLALLYGIILASGIQNLEWEYLRPDIELPSPLLIVVFLIPAVASFLPSPKRGGSAALALVLLFSVAVSVLTVGTLSQQVAQASPLPFYEFSKSLSLFGIAERFEAFVSVALTIGFFSVLSFLLSAAGHLTELVLPGKGRAGVLLTAVVAGLFMVVLPKIPALLLACLSTLLWTVLPLAIAGFQGLKKSKKTKKTP